MKDEILEQIYKTLCVEFENGCDKYGLYEGQIGRLLFLSYYSHYKHDDDVTIKVAQLFDEYITNLYDSILVNPTFSAGITGIMVCVRHLTGKGFIDVEYNELENELWQYVDRSINMMLNENNLDFLYGVIGVGTYSLLNNFKTREINDKIVDCLNRYKIVSSDGYSWNMRIRQGEEYGENIGLAHGMSSVIIYLCKVLQRKAKDNLIVDLIIKAVNFIISNKNTDSAVGSIFPTINRKLNASNPHSRLGWCYGDLGVALALWYAGKTLGDKRIKDFALYTFDDCARRRDQRATLIHDACFCHGTSGIAQVFRRMYYETGKENYRNAAEYWINETVNLYTHEPSCYLFYANGVYRQEIDLLYGIAGIGLTLLAAQEDRSASDWDELFLLS